MTSITSQVKLLLIFLSLKISFFCFVKCVYQFYNPPLRDINFCLAFIRIGFDDLSSKINASKQNRRRGQ